MKALIIGAAGFVGEYLIHALQNVGYEVFATKLKHETLNIGEVSVLDLDITDFLQTKEVLTTVMPDVVFHLAAQSSVKLSWERPQLTANINIVGAINVLEAVRVASKNIRLLLIGSSEEYGAIDYTQAVREDFIPVPKNIYALTKHAQEQLAEIYNKAYGLDVVMTRSFNHIGPKQAHQFVVADFCHQVALIEKGLQDPIIRVGNLAAYRDFTDVRDVVTAYITLVEKGECGEIYNVGSGVPIQIKTILDIILSISNKQIDVVVDPSKFRPIDIPYIYADVTKLKKLGWEPKYSIRNSIEEILSYERDR